MSAAQFQGKVIALTGAAQGMGLATAILLASRGASLSIADIQASTLDGAKEKIQSEVPGAQVHTFALDVRKEEAVEAWIKEAVAKYGRLDGAANLAGVVPKTIHSDSGSVEKMSADDWDFIMDVNAKGLMFCMKYQLQQLGEGGSVVNVSSIAGVTGRSNNGSYAASKHAVIGLTKSAAKEVGPRGVRVNAICPGRIATPMLAQAAEAAGRSNSNTEAERELNQEISLRRVGQPEEVATLIAFLLSSDASYISGASIGIDGGWNC
ncbi:unnamed protein product [Clonostachys solani]|uniref:Uncharacterized protein n=1 Tax=Clonostachys solani TaxID=160281 RepID=A0A9P0EGU1_9HYPO|nr:unnamed protein product [Clonostachys solani]